MKKLSFYLVAAGFALNFMSCGSSDTTTQTQDSTQIQTQTPQVQTTTFTSQEIGWTVEVPGDWISEDVAKMNASVDPNGPQILLQLHKASNNVMLATGKNIGPDAIDEWERSLAKNLESHWEGLKKKGLTFEVKNSEASIDHYDFRVYESEMKNSEGKTVMYESIYASYINGYDFMVILIYNNDQDAAALLKMMEGSTFQK